MLSIKKEKYMVHRVVFLSCILFAGTYYAQWSSTTAKDLKQPVNFSGTLITHQGQEFTVDNISINGKYTKISMALKPENLSRTELNSDTKQMEIKLDADPNTDFLKRDIDLDEISKIEVLNPTVFYVYQKKKNSQRLESIEVDITTKSNTKYSCLMDRRTLVYCDGIDSAGPQETTVPLPALKTLTIEGYTYRDTSSDKKTPCKPNSCPPCEIQK
jgi:hypothetical protein